jgi:hypothetical protein
MSKSIDPVRLNEAASWIEKMSGNSVGRDKDSFQESLKSGVFLCKVLNAIKPGTVGKIQERNLPFAQMENIDAYIKACPHFGVSSENLFMTVDLYEKKDIAQVIQNILSLKRACGYNMEKVSGPSTSSDALLTLEKNQQSSNNYQVTQSSPTIINKGLSRTGPAYQAGQNVETMAPICPVCSLHVTSGSVNALNRSWHPNCFHCKKCSTKLSSSKYYEFQDQPYCDRCILIVNPQKHVKAATTDKGFGFNSSKK